MVVVVGGGAPALVGAAVTVTWTTDCALPPGPVAIAVYCVVCVGLTFTVPLGPKLPTPLIFTAVAFAACQLNTVEEPLEMLCG